MDEVEQEILRLTGIWQTYVCYDHHKDRDGHWYIECDYAYGGPPEWRIKHYGYVGSEVDRKAPTYEAARLRLIDSIRREIRSQQKWAREALEDADEYGSSVRGAAEYILSVDLGGGA